MGQLTRMASCRSRMKECSMRKIITHVVNTEDPMYYQFTLHCDPGHAWLEIPRAMYNAMVRDYDLKISQYSKISDKFVYAEEDCDMALVLKVLNKMNINYEINELIYQSQNNPIRGYSYGYPG